MSGGAVLGWDMSAAFHLGAAMGISPLVIAELLPPIEAAMARKINENMEQSSAGQSGDRSSDGGNRLTVSGDAGDMDGDF